MAKRLLLAGGRPGKWGSVYPEREDADGAIIASDLPLCEARLRYFASVEQAWVQRPKELVDRRGTAARTARPPEDILIEQVQSKSRLSHSFHKGAQRKETGPIGAANGALKNAPGPWPGRASSLQISLKVCGVARR